MEVLICHTDAGSQHPSIAYTERIDDVGAVALHPDDRRQLRQRHGRISHGSLQDRGLHRNAAALATNGGSWKGSTTSRSPPATGCRGSTRSGCTQGSVTRRRPSSKPTTVTDLSPRSHEKPNHRASVKPQAGSYIDSTGIGLLVAMHNEREPTGVHSLSRPKEHFLKLLEMIGLQNFFRHCDASNR